MKQEQIYKKSIGRDLNPAVSVTDTREKTVSVEVNEYVFTAEIINGLFSLLEAVKNKSTNHNGIWISGYYGSGKSHFLKYLNFCLDKRYQEAALNRLIEAVKEFDPLRNPTSKSNVTVEEINTLAIWLKNTNVDSILFNIGDKVGANVTAQSTFAKALWEEFNVFRGFNRFNIALAQYLEKPLAQKGKFDEFKAAIEEEGFDWNEDAQALATTELDTVMNAAKAVAPELTIESIKQAIINNRIDLTPETFCKEISQFLSDKDKNYRLIFFIDEVSQFIGNRKELLLQLQQIVTKINEASDGRVWVGCTAQQDLTELLSNFQIMEAAEDYGKIMGRFEKKVPLQGANTEYITQKRILDKDEDAIVALGKLYDEKKDAISAQFKLPTGYRNYANKQEFIDFYPFIPYQFQLIIRVFDAFVQLQYVDTEVKGNERSVLKITHKTAQDCRNDEVGKFISFDKFFSSMFEAGLKNAGQKAMRNANDIIATYSDDKEFGQRVLRVLFMLCNLADVDQKVFPATIDNIVTLLMSNVDENKLQLKNNTTKVLDYLVEKSVIRVQKNSGSPDIYFFLSEDESQVDRLIKNQKVDNNVMAEELRTIFAKQLGTPTPKVTFNGNNFTVGWTIQGRNYLTQTNPNLLVEFMMDADGRTPNEVAFQNDKKKMLYLVYEEYNNNKKLKDDFFWYCQVQEYLKTGATSEQREKTNKEFGRRASEVFNDTIVPGFKELLSKAPIISGNTLLSSASFGSKVGAERYNEALKLHFEQLYFSNKLVCSPEVPKTADELRASIKREKQPDEYKFKPMSAAEEALENRIKYKGHDTALTDIISDFQIPPYGWNEIAIIYMLNELVRRNMRAFKYKGDPNVDKSKVADTIFKERNSYEITDAQKIDQSIIENFLEAWKDIFGQVGVTYSHDASELFYQCREDQNSPLNKLVLNYDGWSKELLKVQADKAAKVLDDAVEELNKWHSERDAEKFFKLIIASRSAGKEMIDNCKKVVSFHHDQKDAYKTVVDFIQANDDNFSYLPSDCADDIAIIRKSKTDEWKDVIDNMPAYLKRMRTLSGKIDETRKALKSEIEAKYTDVFAELNNFAQEKEVPTSILPSATATITSKTNSLAIASLKLNLKSIDDFRSDMLSKIVAEYERIQKAKSAQSSGGTQPGGGGAPAQTKKTFKVSTKAICKTPQSLKTEADIDAYVEAIKKNLKDKLAENDELIIL